MRILFICNWWHVSKTPCRTIGAHPKLTSGPHEFVRAVGGGQDNGVDINFDLRQDTIADIAERFPGGPPDAAIVWEPGYQALPRGIEEAPFPVVACYSDWNLVMPSQAGMLAGYDFIFTDRPGVRILSQMGFENAEFWPMWGHDPAFSRRIPGVVKSWDIGMVGNLNADVQRERAVWLHRVARMADRYKVRIAGGLFGDEYTRMMNGTKITFNRSIRGEMNMRCYEAAASGSLLFYEEENEEIREFFEDRVHCVLYNERNLEELLEYYINHDEEREQIVGNAYRRVASLSFPENLVRLADRISELGLEPSAICRSQRLNASGTGNGLGSTAALAVRRARQAAGTVTAGCNELAVERLQCAVAADPGDHAALNDLAVMEAYCQGKTKDGERAASVGAGALKRMREAVELCPNSALYRLNLAQMYLDLEWHEAAFEAAQHAIDLLESGPDDPGDPLCLQYPHGWNEVRIQFAGLYNRNRFLPSSFQEERRKLLIHRAGRIVGGIGQATHNRDIEVLGLRIAVAARPDLGSARLALAQALASMGQHQEALDHLDACMQTDPLIMQAWPSYAEMLLREGREGEAAWFIQSQLSVLEALPQHKSIGAQLEALQERELAAA